jgi:hypothetical protein
MIVYMYIHMHGVVTSCFFLFHPPIDSNEVQGNTDLGGHQQAHENENENEEPSKPASKVSTVLFLHIFESWHAWLIWKECKDLMYVVSCSSSLTTFFVPF